MVDLIYCAGENQLLMHAAADAGWLLGVRSDLRSFGMPITFVDIDYRKPDFDMHLQRVKHEQPSYATVADLSETECSVQDIARALQQADILADYCSIPLIVPKLRSQLALIPDHYAIAYSIPSSYGGAKYGPWNLNGRRVHLLGGSPSGQRRMARCVARTGGHVMSVDGNMAQKVCWKLNYWSPSNVWKKAQRGTPYLHCWEQSLINIRDMWRREAV